MDGTNAVILSPDTGKEYYLDAEQVSAFNEKYGIVLQESTQEYLTNSLIDTKINTLQNQFVEQKESLIDQAKNIAEVTAIAAEIETAGEERKIQLNAYADENSLTEISDNAVQTFNATIDDMVASSRTANMLEQYRAEIVESTTFITQATQSTQAFYDQAVMTADDLGAHLNVEWDSYSLSVESEFWQLSSEPEFYKTKEARMEISNES